MPALSALSKAVQVGVEATEGTVVAAARRLQALGIMSGPSVETNRFRPAGQKLDSLVIPGREHTEADLSGFATYSELIYPLSSVLTTSAAVTQIMSSDATPVATGAYTWRFIPLGIGDDTPKTFTVEEGYPGANNAWRFAAGKVVEFGIDFSRDGVELSGALIGHRTEINQTLTANPTTVALEPVVPGTVNVFVDNTSAALGTTKLLSGVGAELSIGDRYAPFWALNSANASYSQTVEGEVDATLTLRLAYDAVGRGFLTDLRDGKTKFIRIESVGSRIYTGNPNVDHLLRLDLAAKIEEGNQPDEDDGALVIEWPLRLVYDGTWGKWLDCTIINRVAAL